ncbi:hypothetical protein QQS21_006446 [Conoideocrella luteorostrata]|uniref:Lectin n=1 Tax=Conoideocrella luteorostrata TaxID=1105319 RepID=A0AAJ0CMH9_9HYPO|nr:hypothetical protein QQS21_006446 [Conoideocrella luteorostrata]
MSYNIQVRIYQSDIHNFFHVVERGVWNYANGGSWTEQDGALKLAMGGSGTSGILRFKPENGDEAFFVIAGVHNYKPWVDIVTGLANNVTGASALPEYYNNTHAERVKAREAQRTTCSVYNVARRTISATFKSGEGHDLALDIVIGNKG